MSLVTFYVIWIRPNMMCVSEAPSVDGSVTAVVLHISS